MHMKSSLKIFTISFVATILLCLAGDALADKPKNPKAKFYDFSEQVIDGEIKKPTGLYTDSRQKVQFDRLLRLKKSFLPELYKTAKERVFK